MSRAAAEFLLIVVGVLVAFALEGWWSSLQDRRAETAYIADLRNELDRNVQTLEGIGRGRTAAQAALLRASRLLGRGQHLDSAQTFIVSLTAGGSFVSPPRIADDAVFEDLQSSGRLQLIKDDDLRRGIIEHYRLLNAMRLRIATVHEEIDSRLTALLVRHIPPGLMVRGRATEVEPASGSDPMRFAEAAKAIVASPSLQAEINAELGTLELEEDLMKRHGAALERQRALLTWGGG